MEAWMSDAAIAVRCRGLAKQFGTGEGSVPALRGVDLDARKGELLMLAGPSGCGKTTLLSIIGGILAPDAGECEVMGQDLRAMDPQARTRFRGQGIGFVFQSFNLLPALSVLDNVCVPLLLRGEAYEAARARARDMLASLDLAGKDEAHPSQLSGGQQQRVALARALVHEPALVICDEPTSNLDARNGHEVMALLRKTVRAPDRALVVVTHDPRIYEFADRIARMEDGRIVDVEAPRVDRQ
jgi:putative ABC transport system ATP-binding protein